MEVKGLGLEVGSKGRKRKYVIGKDIKIDKKFYQEWDLEEVLELPFWKWWKGHRALFEAPSTTISDTPNSWKPKPHYRFIRVDTRNEYSKILKDVQKGLIDLKNKEKFHSKFHVLGEPQYSNEIIKYNMMVRILNEEDDRTIFENEKGRLKIASKGKEKSKLWVYYNEYMKLTPKEREYVKKKIYRTDDQFNEETMTKEGYYYRWAKTEGFRVGRKFDSALRTEINRYISDYQKILNGVAKGQYRKPIKI